MFFHLLDDLFELVILVCKRSLREGRQIQMSLSFLYVIGQPPSHWLYVGIPWIVCFVGVTIIACASHDHLHVFRNHIFFGDLVGTVVGFVARGTNKLDHHQENGEGYNKPDPKRRTRRRTRWESI